MQKVDYTCPSCGYHTNRKEYMRRHFYQNVKHCPKKKHDIELTEEVKQYVLTNRVWHFKKQARTKTVYNSLLIQQTNNNIINNHISELLPEAKIDLYMQHTNQKLLTLDNKVEMKYRDQVDKLDADGYKYDFFLNKDDFYNIIDEISQSNRDAINEMNIIYDDNGKKIKLYLGEWKSLRTKYAIKEIMFAIKNNYLDSYESYLINKYIDPNTSMFTKQKTIEYIEEYYRFLTCIELSPFIESSDLDEEIIDEFLTKFKNVRDCVTIGQLTRTFKEIVEIVTRNSKQNIKELNCKLINVFNMEEDFKNKILTLN